MARATSLDRASERAMFASPDEIAGTTFWTLNLPLELRPRLVACLPEAIFHFITIKSPIMGSAKRIQEARRSAILSFGQGEPPDLKPFLAKTKLPSFRLWTSHARIHGAGHETLGGVGFVLGRGANGSEPDREIWLKSNPLGSAGTAPLRSLFVSLGLSAVNFANAPPARLPPPAAPSDRPCYLVLPNAARSGMSAEARQDLTRQLLAQARAVRPDATFTVLSQVEPGQPSGQPPVPGVPSLPGPYSPELLAAHAGMVTDSHFSGLDALLRGLDVVCLGQPAWRLALPEAGKPPAVSLDAVFEAYFLAGTHYLLPKGQSPANAEAAFRGMAAALPVRQVAAAR